MNSFSGTVYSWCEWIVRFSYINILWFLFSVLGLVILGLIPSTVALFTVMRKWIMGSTDFPIFKTFWKTYQTELIKSNILGLGLGIIGFILFIDFIFLQTLSGWFLSIMTVLLIIITILFIVILFYIFPVYVHYNVKNINYLKYAFIIGVIHPARTILISISVISVVLVLFTFPGIIPFFSVNIISFIIMRIAYSAFKNIEIKVLENNFQ
ncbi:putative membrane protein YesL [Evansella vedderi]|uniref:Membrane protein YesL n=1 Tax=Evansella vedderi TaxID=38282 RepID=A0ABU0A1H9_9BACI|nr:YesL family protein [Evansella vedderi]MDQ0257341.1 putative membrane protein YesL [Evansella vedderi]